jgi:Arm DNA-binding domain
MAQKLTDREVRALVWPATGNQITYDSIVSSFGVRITARGAIAFILNYRVRATGQERRYTIGSYPDWTVGQAREKAKELKREVDSGGDPLGKEEAAATHRRSLTSAPGSRRSTSRSCGPTRRPTTEPSSTTTSCPFWAS